MMVIVVGDHCIVVVVMAMVIGIVAEVRLLWAE